jgi:UDP-N-acetylmuramate dehydrogenase
MAVLDTWDVEPLVSDLRMLGAAVQERYPMARQTSFKIGGPARVFWDPAGWEEMVAGLERIGAGGAPLLVLGLGSNLLVSDGGFPGVVVSTKRALRQIRVEQETLTLGAGVPLAKAAHVAARHGLSGLEFAISIPGTVGGAATMNAGAHGSCFADIAQEVTVFDPVDGVLRLPATALDYRYRWSAVQARPWVVLEATVRLARSSQDRVEATMQRFMAHRKQTQPVGEKNAGSMFKNPEPERAGRLIEQAGAKGWRVGGAVVSSLHANFIINVEDATAADVLTLMRRVRAAVQARFHIWLRPEVRWVGPHDGEDDATWDNLWLKEGDGLPAPSG